ncbi:MAG: NirD/YgiW/YdeI family stress tolerance protein [Treponema sp.]|jgi:uncharacterized protein (TIGR00156 family)|nr:NirD/YgiW/YdeI family stress tolerance protein [Treponema sp.]
MKKYTLFFACCLITLFTAITISAQGFGPGINPPPPPGGPAGQFGYGFTGPGQTGFTGQYGYTGPVQTSTVAQARALGHHAPVIVTGNIVQAIGGDLYIFRDSSGDINLRIGPREWMYFGSTIGPSDTIEISGEIHWPRHSWNVPELHARFMRKL